MNNQVFYYEEYISSEGLELDYSTDGSIYRLFNRRQNGIDILEFNSSIDQNRQVRIVERLNLDGRTQYFRRQKHPSNMVDCLSSRDDGSCLYLIDLEKPHKPYEFVMDDKLIKAYDTYDDYGKLFCLSSHDTVYFYDTRSKSRSVLSTVTNAMESKFNLIYNTFRDGRMINAVTVSNVLVFDIRNPGECVLKFKHFCDVPPNRHTFAKSIDEEFHRDLVDNLVAGENLEEFEKKVSGLLNDNVEVRDKSLKNSVCLYSCRKNSFPVFLTSYEPLDKQDVENKFNYDIIKEINQTLDPNRLFSQLTRSEVRTPHQIHPQRLFSSNIIDSEQHTNGVSLVYHREKVYFLHLDNHDHLSMQVIQKKDRERGFAFRKILKDDSVVYDEAKFKALVKFEEYPRMLLRKTSVHLKPQLEEGEEEFLSESLELESVDSEKIQSKTLKDVRKLVTRMVNGAPKFAFKEDSQAQQFAEYQALAESLRNEEPAQPRPAAPGAYEPLFPQNRLGKDDLELAQKVANERFFITKQGFNLLTYKY